MTLVTQYGSVLEAEDLRLAVRAAVADVAAAADASAAAQVRARHERPPAGRPSGVRASLFVIARLCVL